MVRWSFLLDVSTSALSDDKHVAMYHLSTGWMDQRKVEGSRLSESTQANKIDRPSGRGPMTGSDFTHWFQRLEHKAPKRPNTTQMPRSTLISSTDQESLEWTDDE